MIFPAYILAMILAGILASILGVNYSFFAQILMFVIMSIPVYLFIYGISMIKHGIVFCLLSIILLLSISPTYINNVKSHKVEPNSEIYNSGAYTYKSDIDGNLIKYHLSREEKINWVLLSIYIIIFIYGIYLILFVNLGTTVTPAIPTISTNATPTITTTES